MKLRLEAHVDELIDRRKPVREPNPDARRERDVQRDALPLHRAADGIAIEIEPPAMRIRGDEGPIPEVGLEVRASEQHRLDKPDVDGERGIAWMKGGRVGRRLLRFGGGSEEDDGKGELGEVTHALTLRIQARSFSPLPAEKLTHSANAPALG